jgi:hypothetical protein
MKIKPAPITHTDGSKINNFFENYPNYFYQYRYKGDVAAEALPAENLGAARDTLRMLLA